MSRLVEEAMPGVFIGVGECEEGMFHGVLQYGVLPERFSASHWPSEEEALTFVRSVADQYAAFLRETAKEG